MLDTAGVRSQDGRRPAGRFGAAALLLLLLPLSSQAAYSLTVTVKNISNNAVVSQLAWTGPSTGWLASGQYLQVDYSSTASGWGIQIYTNNLAASADPRYTGSTSGGYEGVGLIGATDTTSYCPMGWAAYDTLQAGAPTVPGTDDIPVGNKWSWMKDSMQTAGAYPFTNGDAYITFVNYNGYTLTNNTNRAAAASPVFLYIMVCFSNRPNQVYRTNQLTFELYHQ